MILSTVSYERKNIIFCNFYIFDSINETYNKCAKDDVFTFNLLIHRFLKVTIFYIFLLFHLHFWTVLFHSHYIINFIVFFSLDKNWSFSRNVDLLEIQNFLLRKRSFKKIPERPFYSMQLLLFFKQNLKFPKNNTFNNVFFNRIFPYTQ